MTTAVVYGILKPLLEKLASSADEELELVCGVKDDREKLKNTLETIQRVLIDAEQRQTKDEAVSIWLSKLKDFCYVVEDVLDDFEARALWRRVRSTKHLTLKRKVSYLFSWISNFIFQFKMAHNMKELRKRLDGINEEKSRFNLSGDIHDKIIVPWRETHSFVTPLNMIGRNEEKEMILELLKRSDGGARMIGVISIFGMGGIGKTALAQPVYNDGWVNRYFDLKVWLSMPVGFETKNIIRGILEYLGHKEKFDNLEMLQNILRRFIGNKRCLFVMDNVWGGGKIG
ncbi:disease resistance protein RGA2-like [Syzygium oleosum]|uniref:disease resistance protein RGA2-like n=1 Tax=Syzygium oleosum TaxID=219896 RepID=UPI0024B979FA|nr:disease resistance protein RGA2-like [Syzygium oleosum]